MSQVYISTTTTTAYIAHCRAKASPMLAHTPRLCAVSFQSRPANFCMSSTHRCFGLPLPRLNVVSCQNVALCVHLLSSLLATCPAHFHLRDLIRWLIPIHLVWFLTHMLVFLSFHVIPNIRLSILLWELANFLRSVLLRTQVSDPYVIDGITH